MANDRVFYSCMQVAFSKRGATQPFIAAHGVQSAQISTTFNIEAIFEYGQLDPYENVEQIPEVEMTVEKVLDGRELLYHLATNGSASPTLAGRQNVTCEPALGIFDDKGISAGDASVNGGDPIAVCHMPRMVVNSVAYNFSVDGPFTENITLSGNEKLWKDFTVGDELVTFVGAFTTGLDAPLNHVQLRQNLRFTPLATGVDGAPNPATVDENGCSIGWATVIPKDIKGTTTTGLNQTDMDGRWVVPIQNISVSVDLNRQSIYELGRRTYYIRFINFPVDVTCDFDVLMTKFDAVSASEAGGMNGAASGYNLVNRTIRIRTEEGTMIDLGTRNKLRNVTLSGGDASSNGGFVSTRYSYTTQNTFVVTHPLDPSFV